MLARLYESGVDLYYNDGSGNQVQITSGGMVNATSSGISGGTATAAFVANVLIVNQNTNTPGDIKCGSVFIGNNTVSSYYVEVSAPNALAGNYQLVLPAIPGSTLFLTLDTSGNIKTASNVSAAQIASGSITGAQIVSGAALAGNVTVGGTFTATGAISTSSTVTANNTITGANLVTGGSITATGSIVTSGALYFGTASTRPALTRFSALAVAVDSIGGAGKSYPVVVNGGANAGMLICRCTVTVTSASGVFTGSPTNNGADGVSCTSASSQTLTFTFTDTSAYPNGDYTDPRIVERR